MLETLRTWAVQDSPPGAAITALVARGDVEVGALDRAIYEERTVVALYNARSATAVVPADEVAAYATAQLPADESEYSQLVRNAVGEQQGGVELATEAISDALDGRALSRDDLHEQLRQRLPGALLPWCEGCQSHHARRGLLIMAGLRGKLCISGRVGRQPEFARTDQLIRWNAPADAGAELVERYRNLYGDSSAADFAEWSGLARPHAKRLWESTDAKGGGERLDGVRLLGPGDPQLQRRDREAFVPDPAWRKQVWKAIGGAGVITQDGAVVGLWRARKKGKTLELTVEGDAPDVREPAERLAPHRGCTAVKLR
ncbi:winged helix DNA-binding domain-containing protein [Solirubrobacter sp. CPCC 204708]|uniref:Winged helix DNA-binding domain-containing protein n=1 Tax=Solirubrobacter deserti TaxID=2282478 RepID=A0ABT4RBM0_9ACTN|nr:crosslink repair DNA glycosylase YcaQ family protein [Solirubrobacter deserti]MBE2317187.1 winged helix DNA-binding domain-containing protein [Solirubrobacter deserti]MDA0135920.1 winged helix DNA-binding domain-containing protein [Solirubrobacter deserti]